MKVLVFGATGRAGKAVVERAFDVGHDVTAFIRDASEGRALNVRLAQGDATNRADVDAAILGQEAVIDLIGGKAPYKETTVESTAANTIIASMQANGVCRLLATSMLGVGGSKENVPVYERLLLVTFLRGADNDKSAMESAVGSSGLHWTILRPVFPTDDAATVNVRVFKEGGGEKAHKITRADVAAFMVEQLTNTTYVHQAVTIANS